MQTTIRFEQAVKKLYDSFHNDTLNPDSCTQCAVGNILDNQAYWRHFSDDNGSLQLNYVGLVHQNLGRKFNGYSPLELLQIEMAFLKACGYSLPFKQNKSRLNLKPNKDQLFNGLVAVVSELCRIDNLPNAMDCSALFDYEREIITKPKQDLIFANG